ncbi:hypothetical protein COCSUDRAFT_47695 [Coccomyxa subellipsoidea C-169]|uniref:N-end rule aminoacyl transferase C-terminal domain-containing protein n=1 Tax=Coccomyxa subellipsoidea (strain C-169) TaxID=574566 RepID=I0YWM0_COCSC|nr:hypothetical protein COCSUDRAFT_47695 [Coccomyxa subellipsoidea C-169]EIE22789.1 hypothetical protein COCSUDRAFT_47695 [Coccomyxa subellipsoidea C-169]|eukprot:XP_005647333.1 hypothetical protein COCSUDRAFT_47695 [Coccomyxa subellipsoidea C-169]
MSRAISHAVRRMTEEGTLPEACYYSPDVKEVSSKQRRLLGPQALLTTAAAFPIAAAARRAAGPGSPSAEHLAALLAVRLEGAAGLQLSVQAKRGHLNFMMQPGALCDVRSGDDSAAVGGEEATCSMSTDSRDCGQHAGGAREHSSRGSSQTAEDAPEHASSASRMTKGATVSAQWGGVSRREIHVDAGSRRFEVRLVPMPASRAEIAAEYPLYRRYQTIHHHESPQEVKESSFRRFLVDSPLMRRRAPLGPDGQVPYWSFGSYHQQYWIDGELVAVAVLDVLPQCISSVYFFWEPSLSFLSLGKVSALREIAFVQAAAMTCPSLHCYYMGYFISSCPKMRYKADFKPSDLLCMHSLCWVPVERAVPALDADMHCIISRIPGALEGLDATFMGDCSEACDYLSDAALDATLLYLSSQQGQRRLIRLGQLARTSVPQEALCLLKEKLRSWRKYVGPAADQYIHVM